MTTPSHKDIPSGSVETDRANATNATASNSNDEPSRTARQTLNTHIDTSGGPYIGGNVSAGGKFVGRDDHSVTIVSPSPPIALPVQPPASPQLFIGRQDELCQLDEWLTAVTPDFLRNGEQPEGKLALIYGPPAAGKSTLIRHWLAALRTGQAPPIMAHLSFERALLVNTTQTVQALSQSRYTLAWEEPDDKLRSHFPAAFPLDCYFWVTLALQLARQSPHLCQALERDEE